MKSLHLRIQQVVAADQTHVLQQLAGEEGDDRAVVGRTSAVEQDGVIDLRLQHRLEHDLPRLLGRERLHRQFRIAERRGIKLGQVPELAIETTREPRQRDVQRVDVLVRVLSIDLDDERILPVASRRATHGDVIEGHAFALDRFDELHEGGRAHDRNRFPLRRCRNTSAASRARGFARAGCCSWRRRRAGRRWW